MTSSHKVFLFLAGLCLIIGILVCVIAVLTNLRAGGRSTALVPTLGIIQAITANAAASTSIPPISQPTQQFELSGTPFPAGPPPAILESRHLTLEYPQNIRTGDSDIIRLTLEVSASGDLTATAEVQGDIVKGQTIQFPNLYATHNVIAEARLDLAGPEIRPNDAVDEPLLPGEAVTFLWSVHPTQSGTYRGTAWLYLIFVDKLTKQEARKAISAQLVQIVSTDLLGLNGNAARAAGGVGAMVGAVLGFPFATDILKWLFGRMLKKTN